VTKVGPKQGKRASWIGASGDQTFFKLDESLINDKQFQNSTVIASNSYFGECKLNYFFKCLFLNPCSFDLNEI